MTNEHVFDFALGEALLQAAALHQLQLVFNKGGCTQSFVRRVSGGSLVDPVTGLSWIKRPYLFHPKTVLVGLRLPDARQVRVAVVGSGNLTGGGLAHNTELGVISAEFLTPNTDVRWPQLAEILGAWWKAAEPLRLHEVDELPVDAAEMARVMAKPSTVRDADGQVVAQPSQSHHRLLGVPSGTDRRSDAPASPRPLFDESPTSASDDHRADSFQGLYEYQEKAVTQAIRALLDGQSPCVALPTGAGKTEIATEIIRRYFLTPQFHAGGKQTRVLVVTPKRELCRQFYEMLRARGVSEVAHVVLYEDGRIVCSGPGDRSRPLIFVATDKAAGRSDSLIMERLAEAGFGREFFDAFVLDEAHHAPSDAYQNTMDDLRRRPGSRVGLTATPFRLDGKPLEFDTYIVARLPHLIETGFLARPQFISAGTGAHYRIGKEDLTTLSNRSGSHDLKPAKLASIGRDRARTDAIVREILEHKERRRWTRTIVFCASVAEAQSVTMLLRRRIGDGGVACVVGEADADDIGLGRDDAVEAFRAGRLEILVNCQIFIEGFDVPDADSIVLARPTTSLNYYKQMIGRGSRICVHSKKVEFDVLEFSDQVDLDDGIELVHSQRAYGFFERGYGFAEANDELSEYFYCDDSSAEHSDAFHVPLVHALARLEPAVSAHERSPFHRARR